MSRLFRLPLVALLLILMMSLLAACGTTAAPTPLPTLAAGMQTFSVTDRLGGTLTVLAPTGTFSKSDPDTGSLNIATSEAALAASDTSVFAAKQWGLSFGALPMSIVQAFATNGQTLTPQLVVDAFKSRMMTRVTQVSFGASQPVTIGSKSAARVAGTSPQGDVLLLVVALDNSYLLVTGVIAKGELAVQESLLTNIVASATYTTTP